MINYVFINFLPGAAGNFFSRTLNLIDDAYCWVPTSFQTLDLTLEQKLEYFSYKNIQKEQNWIDFECELIHYSSLINHTDLPDNAISIWAKHNTDHIRRKHLSGKDDTESLIQITYNDSIMFEWILLNALYKNSHINPTWFKQYQIYSKENDVIKINLKKFINKDKFLTMYSDTIKLLNISPSHVHLDAVEELHNQWIKTTLSFDKFDEFKSSIGWLI